LDDITKH